MNEAWPSHKTYPAIPFQASPPRRIIPHGFRFGAYFETSIIGKCLRLSLQRSKVSQQIEKLLLA